MKKLFGIILFVFSALITFTSCSDGFDANCGCWEGDPGYGQTTGGGDVDANSWETSSVWYLNYYPENNENLVVEDGFGSTLTVDASNFSLDALQYAYLNDYDGSLPVYVVCEEGYGAVSGTYYSDCDITGF